MLEIFNSKTYPIFSNISYFVKYLSGFIVPVAVVCIGFAILYGLYKILEERFIKGNKQSKSILLFFDGMFSGLIYLLRKLPLIIVFTCLLFAINTSLIFMQDLKSYVENQKRIKELTTVVKNLSRTDRVARITVTDQFTAIDSEDEIFTVTTYNLEILSTKGNVLSSQTFKLYGEELWLDSMCLNFDYSQLDSGKSVNLAYPYRLHSETMSASDAVSVSCVYNEEQLPVMYLFEDDEIYGMDENTYLNRLKELYSIINDDIECKKMGIRSFYGNDIHFTARKGDEYILNVQGTGGLTLSKIDF